MVGDYLVSGSKDKTIKLFKLLSRDSLKFTLIATYIGH